MDSKAAARVLNRAFQADPGAIHARICNRVPRNATLADDPTVVVQMSEVVNGGITLGALGLINGVLGELGLHWWP